MTADDFRRLNFREVGKWPLAPKLIVLTLVVLFIVALGAFFDWKDQWDVLQAAEQQEGQLKTQFTEKKAKAIGVAEYAHTWIEQRNVKPRTRSGYHDLLRLHIGPMLGKVPLKNLTRETVRGWVFDAAPITHGVTVTPTVCFMPSVPRPSATA